MQVVDDGLLKRKMQRENDASLGENDDPFADALKRMLRKKAEAETEIEEEGGLDTIRSYLKEIRNRLS